MRIFAAVLSLAIFVIAAPVSAENRIDIGGNASFVWNQLSQPADPAGQPTVLFGSAFTGPGIALGAMAIYPVTQLGPGQLKVRGDLLFGYQSGSAFAESRTQGFKRELSISRSELRVPLVAQYAIGDTNNIYFLVGPEFLLGVSSSSGVVETGTGTIAEALRTTTGFSVAITGGVGFAFEFEGWQIPIEARFDYNPFVAKSTLERFVGFRSNDDPGDYMVDFTWQFLFTIGAAKIFTW